MQQFDKYVFKYSPVIVIISAVFYNLTLSHLLDSGYSSPSVLIYRGIITMSITLLLAFNSKQSVLPQKLHLQVLRLLNTGIALMLTFEAYRGLAASTVAMVSRLDIPLAILIGFAAGARKKDFRVGLSVFAVCLVLSILFFSATIDEQPLGLLLALGAVTMTSISYLLIKRSTTDENNFSIVNTTNIGCIAVGLVVGTIRGNLTWMHWEHLWIFALASLSQFSLNYTMSVVYREKEVERAQRPYLAGAIAVLIIEQILRHKLFAPLHIVYILVVITTIYLITVKHLPGGKQFAWINSKLNKNKQPLIPDPQLIETIE